MKDLLNFNLRIYVTKYDIDCGIRLAPSSCPVALSIKRAFKKKFGRGCVPQVCTGIKLEEKERVFFAEFPQEHSSFVVKFDSGEVVEPFSTTLKFRSK